VIHWIYDHLGTAAFDHASQIPGITVIDVRDLVDKAGNSVEILKAKIEQARVCLDRGDKVVICCDYGMSRSNSVAAGVLAQVKGVSLGEAVRKIIETIGEKNLKIEVLNRVYQAIGKDADQAEPDREKRILVTGANGFIGKGLIEKLIKKGYTVFAPPKQEIDLLHDAVFLNLMVKEKGIGKILHLANPRIYTVNMAMGETLVMLENVLDVCVENNVKLIYLSNWEVYSGYRTSALLAYENVPLCPGGSYGRTKVLCENLIDHYRKQYSVSCLILRSSSVYGIECDRPKFIWNFLNKAREHKEIVTHEYGNGFPSLDLLHVSDLRRAILMALESGLQGAINFGTGILTSTARVANQIIKMTDSKSNIKHQNIEGDVGNIKMDISKARLCLGWEPDVAIDDGLFEIVGGNKDENISVR
jgi:UDP-glucuronate decarboxylase